MGHRLDYYSFMCRLILFFYLFFIGLCFSCTSGKLTITLDHPTVPALDPLQDTQLSKFTLHISQAGSVTEQEANRGKEEAEIGIGDVPTEVPFDLRLSGKSATNALLGVAAAQGLRLTGDGKMSLKLNFRKPLAYVFGGEAIRVLNIAADSKASTLLESIPVGNTLAGMVTVDGGLVITTSGQSLISIPTADHASTSTVELPAMATCVAASPDGLYAAVCHAATKSVSILEVQQISNGTPAIITKSLNGEPDKIIFDKEDPGKAWVLVTGMKYSQSCGGITSQLVQIKLSTGEISKQIELDRPVADFAVDPRDGSVLLALPCEENGAIGRIKTDTVEILASVPSPYTMLINAQSILTMGFLNDSSGKVQISRFDITKAGPLTAQTVTFVFPPLMINYTRQGNKYPWSSEPTEVKIYKILIAPEGKQSLVFFQANYASDATFQDGCQFRARVQGTGFLLMDPVSGKVFSEEDDQSQLVPWQWITQLDFSPNGCTLRCPVWVGGSTCEKNVRDILLEDKALLVPEFQPLDGAVLFEGT